MKKTNHELETVLKNYKAGTISSKQAVNQIGSFVGENYPIFGLHKYDEDFRQDILLGLLEHGESLINNYDPEIGDFFTFLYSYINTLKSTKIRHLAILSLSERIINEELKKCMNEKIFMYSSINYSHFDMPKAPYSYKPIPADELKKSLQGIAFKNQDKKLLVLALKSCYYLTDEQIDKICKIYGLEREVFCEMIQHCKDSIQHRADRRAQVIDRRDTAYYRHRRNVRLAENLNNKPIENKDLIARINKKIIRYNNSYVRLNNIFEDGLLILRPTSKTIANLLGICERQVNYYINCARKEYELKLLESNQNEE